MPMHKVQYSSHCVLRIKAKKCAEVLKIRIPTTSIPSWRYLRLHAGNMPRVLAIILLINAICFTPNFQVNVLELWCA